MTADPPGPTPNDFYLERYRFILQQLQAANDNVHRFLAIYQTLATALAGAAVALFVGYHKWNIAPGVARAGIVAVLWIVTLVAAFTLLLLLVGVLTWLDYRREECQLTEEIIGPHFRDPPRPRNFIRWYETYIAGFIVASVALMWLIAYTYFLPAIG
ncbi:DUF2157 domain-containing protein [Actinoplanes sp. NPDC051343]|uniref:DUF2157 domain-containing protein n=1 Tax=Actinoplanes sp. NPDC051343 TaxID=3363906 RepID=UPI003792B5A2